MRPMLEVLADGAERDTVWLRDQLASRFDVSKDERAQLLPSGTGRLYDNRVAWAYVHLQHAGAIDRVARATYRITRRGLKLLADYPERIDVKVLSQFPELVAFRKGGKGKKRKMTVSEEAQALDDERSPTERLADAHADHQSEITTMLLERIRECHPTFFRDKQQRPEEYGLVSDLLDVRLLHLLEPSLSDRHRAGEKSEVYMLDLSQYSGQRLKHNVQVLDFRHGHFETRVTRTEGKRAIGDTPRRLITIFRAAPELPLTSLETAV
jgi:Mrr N-terminal domain